MDWVIFDLDNGLLPVQSTILFNDDFSFIMPQGTDFIGKSYWSKLIFIDEIVLEVYVYDFLAIYLGEMSYLSPV